MKAAISERAGVDAELIKGSGGVFDVVVDGDLIYSKKKMGRFPQNSEILAILEAIRG